MLMQFESLAQQLGVQLETLLAAGVGFGMLLVSLGLWATFGRRDAALDRLHAISDSRRQARQDQGLLRSPTADPRGLMKAFIPDAPDKRNALQARIYQAGLNGPHALRTYMMVRIALALVLPAAMLMLLMAARNPSITLPLDLSTRLGGLSMMNVFQILTVLIALGYVLPVSWLNRRIEARKLRIEEGFPNALDMLQISIEAGLGFDAAMTRVGNELRVSSPDIAYELLTVQHQVQAGREREAAMSDMADRAGLDTIRSFSNVVRQSMKFGTPMGQALTTYSEELRQTRELRAQEMANKLPVKMSMVLASLMLPALILMTLGPIVIRYIHTF